VFVAASTNCFAHLERDEAIEKLVDLEFSAIEMVINEEGDHLKPSLIMNDFEGAVAQVSATRRLDVVAFGIEMSVEGPEYMDCFTQICKLAKATKVVTLTVPSGQHGTPFNEEVERFKEMVKIAEAHGVRVGMRSTVDHLSGDPDTVSVICGHVKGLGLGLDPSHYIYQRETPANYDDLLQYVTNVYLRDSTKDKLQVRVGQGIVDYGKLINQLTKVKYNRSLVIDSPIQDDVDHMGEMRKLRLLLESLL
jgi:sugar phosphate isomerase/epimerase